MVILAGKEQGDTGPLQVCAEFLHHLLDLGNDALVVLFLSHLDHGLDVLVLALQSMIGVHLALGVLQFLHHLGGFLCVIPETRLLHLLFHFRDALLLALQIQGIPDLLQGLFKIL